MYQQLKFTTMKRILLLITLLLVGLYFSIIVFNEIHAWAGIFMAIAIVGGFFWFLSKDTTKKK